MLTFVISTAVSSVFADRFDAKEVAKEFGQNQNSLQKIGVQEQAKSNPAEKLFESLDSINFPLIIGCFIVYFLGGYLLYSALFAAIGAAVDNETETQQFMLPVTVPLIFAFIVAQTMITNPDSQIGFWFSLFPLT